MDIINRRLVDGIAIHLTKPDEITIDEGPVVRVRSQSDPGSWYTLNFTKVPVRCGCKDWLARKRDCKHIYAAKARMMDRRMSVYDIPKLAVPEIKYEPPPWVTDVGARGLKPYKKRSKRGRGA